MSRILKQLSDEQLTAVTGAIDDDRETTRCWTSPPDNQESEKPKGESGHSDHQGEKRGIDDEDTAGWPLKSIPGEHQGGLQSGPDDDRLANHKQIFNPGVLPDSTVNSEEQKGEEVDGNHIG